MTANPIPQFTAPTAAPSAATMEMIGRLVAFDTVSRNSNLALIHWVRDYLAGFGVSSRLVPDESGSKANLFATLGPAGRGGIALSGHTDVVPVEAQSWSSDPFRTEVRDGRLYGRGSADMKGFIAIALTLVPEFLRRGLKEPLHLVLSYDEEVGCGGARRLVAEMANWAEKPRLCIVGEPTEMQVVIGHKGKSSHQCHVRGRAGHSSLTHKGVNAVEAAAEIIAHIKSLARQRRDHGPFDPAFEPPYTTLHTGTVAGGTALNIVPSECHFDFEIRNLPQEDVPALLSGIRDFARARVEPEMKAVDPSTGVDFAFGEVLPGLATAEEAEVTTLVKQLAEANGTAKVSFATEAGLFDGIGVPTIVCGPGSIEQAHKADEWIALDQIAAGEAFLRRLMAKICL